MLLLVDNINPMYSELVEYIFNISNKYILKLWETYMKSLNVLRCQGCEDDDQEAAPAFKSLLNPVGEI